MNKEIDKVGPLFGAYLDLVGQQKTVSIGDQIVSVEDTQNTVQIIYNQFYRIACQIFNYLYSLLF